MRASGAITRQDIANAFLRVPREVFVPHVSLEAAYRDHAIPFKFDEDGSAISSSSQPAIMALMLEQLDVRPGMHVLEVGAGSGYNAALLAELVGPSGHLTTVDIDEELVAGARANLIGAGYERVEVVCADGLKVISHGEHYDRILLTASTNEIAAAWIAALPEQGHLVLPLIIGLQQASVGFLKRGDALESDSIVPALFMMLRTLNESSRLTVFPEVPTVRVRTKGTLVNREALMRNLRTPSRAMALKLGHLNMWALGLWVDLHDPLFTRVAAHDQAAARGLVPQYDTVSSSENFVATEGLCDGENLCLFGESIDKRIEIVCYGNADALAARLRDHVRAWAAAGSPTQQQLRVSAFPDQREVRDAAAVLRSAGSTVVVRYTTAGQAEPPANQAL